MTPTFYVTSRGSVRAPNGHEFKIVGDIPAPVSAAKRKAHRTIPKPLDGEPRSSGVLLLSMAPPSVNSLFHNRAKGRGKTLAYRNWRSIADHDLRQQDSWHVPGRVAIVVKIQPSAGDCDNRLKACLDSLVTAGRIEDDKNVVRVTAEWAHDVRGTRIEIERAE